MDTIEYVVRRKGYNISTLGNDLKVNRRSIYNWFSSKTLKTTVIFQIGSVLRQDFSVEFTELFTSQDFEEIDKIKIYNDRNIMLKMMNGK